MSRFAQAASVAGPTYSVAAKASSALAVTLTIDASSAAVCSISGSTVSFIGEGTCTIDANQGGNGEYSAAPQEHQSFAVAAPIPLTGVSRGNEPGW